MSNSLQNSWPELAGEWASHEQSMPNETSATSRVMEMGPISRLLFPNAYAVTGPLGTIAFNRKLIDQDKQNVGDVVRHELTHIGQGTGAMFKAKVTPGGVQQLENQAVNAEALRPVRRTDINLPIDTRPSKELVRNGKWVGGK